ncbi:hypothetical protein [Microscilla marina]|uniref:Uncharacterized protein n=1 Tax=Microscilla marina ATCC 23134 TaxID=313606 RepID=A1ZIE5_MICM2|nr:hypothetical protein [Microscilla marina]EAY29813.1 hypothetical protein M23134_05686 [Microscilla marina ATCC 23134]
MKNQKQTDNTYKKRINLDFEAVIRQGISLKLDEQTILGWAYDFAKSGKNKSFEEDGTMYYWLRPEKCRNDLPTLEIASKRGMQKKFEKLVKKGLLIPHRNRSKVGAYYAFSPVAKKLFDNTCILAASDLPNLKKRKEQLITLLVEVSQGQTIDHATSDQLFTLIVQNLLEGRPIVHQDYASLFTPDVNGDSPNNIVNNNIVNDNKIKTYTLSKEKEEKEIFESKEQIFTAVQEEEREENVLLKKEHTQAGGNDHEKLNKDLAALEKRMATLEARELERQKETAKTNESLLSKVAAMEKRMATLEARELERQKETAKTNESLLKRLSVLEKKALATPVKEEVYSEKKSTQVSEKNQSVATEMTENKPAPSGQQESKHLVNPVPSKEEVIQIFTEEGSTVTMAEKYFSDNLSLIQEGLISEATVRRNALSAAPADTTQASPDQAEQKPENTAAKDTARQHETYHLAQETYEAFNILPSKKELGNLMQQISNIQQERDLSIQQMRQNLQMYQRFIQTHGVTTNYSLKNWLTIEGNGYGRDWSKDLDRVQKKQDYQRKKEMGQIMYTSYQQDFEPATRPDWY